jgi:serine protease Do
MMDTHKQLGGYHMDTYENENPGLEPVIEPVMEPAEAAAPAEAVAAAPAKNRAKPILAIVGAVTAFAVVLAVAVSSVVALHQSNRHWENEMALLTESMNNKVAVLEEQLEAVRDNGYSVSGTPNTAADGLTPAQVYAQNKMAVVAISCSAKYGSAGTATSSGSGFVLTEDGYVITNCHVVDGADTVTVVMLDGREFEAKVKGYDQNNDLAVLKVDAQGLQTVKLGRSSDLIIGDMVVAIGNPLGELTSTQTVGYISGKDRDVSTDGTLINMLQTDAAINPGNSGGPLFNMKGEVVGITTAKYSGTTSSGASIEGIGFAIPIDDVTKMISDIMAYGYVTGAYLGVSVADIDDAQASYYGNGAYVMEVVDGYCAKKAGIQPGDLIVDLGGYRVESVAGLTRALRNFNAGDTTTITVLRKGREVVLEITLDEKPNLNAPQDGEEIPMPSEGDYDEWYEYFYRKFYGEDAPKP